MQTKLISLEEAISQTQIPHHQLQELDQYEKVSLQQMPLEAKLMLFKSIVRCLCGREIVSYYKALRIEIKKEDSFFGWSTCYLNCDSNHLILFKKKECIDPWHQFAMTRLKVSKIYKKYKKKFVFGFVYSDKKFQIGHEDEAVCSKLLSILQSLIREQKERKIKAQQSNLNDENSPKKLTLNEGKQVEFQKEDGLIDKTLDEDDFLREEEVAFLTALSAEIGSYNFADEGQFQLIKNVAKGRMLLNSKTGCLKINLITQNCLIQNMIDDYIKFTAWNAQIDTFKVVNRIRCNSYIASLKLKRFSRLSYPRSCYLTITYFKKCTCLVQQEDLLKKSQHNTETSQQQNHYLLIKSFHNSDSNEDSGTVQMEFDQVIKFTKMAASQNVLIQILSNIDYCGYQYLTNSTDVIKWLMEDVASLTKFFQQREFIAGSDKLFVYNYCVCSKQTKRRGSQVIQIQRKRSSIKQRNIPGLNPEKKQVGLEPILKAIEDFNHNVRNDFLIEVIQKKYYQSYYLHYHFDFSVDLKYEKSGYNLATYQDIFKGKWRLEQNDLVFIDEAILKSQKGILKLVLKEITSNIMKGQSLMSMSLPVQLFQKKSMLQLLAELFGYLPKCMAEAVKCQSVIEQIKFIALIFILGNSCNMTIGKPFNPILGETFEGCIGGIPIYLEQICHHPPVSSVYMKTSDFQLWGNFQMVAQMGLNSVYSKNQSYLNLKIFKNNRQYLIRVTDLQIGGVLYGDRIVRLSGKSFVFQKNSNTICEISMGKEKKKLYQYNYKVRAIDVAGGIFKVTNQFKQKLFKRDRTKAYQGLKVDDVIEKYSQLYGKWTSQVKFNDVEYRNLAKGPFPCFLEKPKYLLPSDSLFRDDIVYRKWDILDKSNQSKRILQDLQRADAKLRKKYAQK